MMGFLHLTLRGLPYDENGSLTELPQVPDWQRQAGDKAAALAQELLDNLSGNQIADFNAFRAEYLGVYMEEFTHKQLIAEQQSTT